MTNFKKLLEALRHRNVEFILVGGVAATAHGSARLTIDLDIVYRRSADNHSRLVRALSPHTPYLRGAPPGLPFVFDEDTLNRGLNFTLTTALGDIDLLGEIVGGGNYDQLLSDTVELSLYGYSYYCLSLSQLIHVKRAAGRPKDLEVIAELEKLLAESK